MIMKEKGIKKLNSLARAGNIAICSDGLPGPYIAFISLTPDNDVDWTGAVSIAHPFNNT